MDAQSAHLLTKQTAVRLLFGLIVGLFLGMMGVVAKRPFVGIVSGGFLGLLLASLQIILQRTTGIFTGVTSGAILGVIIALFGLAFEGQITDGQSGFIFGIIRGVVIGCVFGYLTRAKPEQNDSIAVQIFLLLGSIIIGAILGGVVGLFSGYLLGVLKVSDLNLLIAISLGFIVGAYIFSYLGNPKIVILGGLLFSFLTTIGQLIGGAISGVFLGAVSGLLVPIILMGIIGAYGGFSRGALAMIKETIQTPSEMIIQGAVPMLAPAMLVGLIIGTAAVGLGSILVIPAVLAAIGLLLGAFGEFEGRTVNRVTPKEIIERLILGNDRWPLRRLLKRLKSERVLVLKAAIAGFIIGIVGGGVGYYLGQFLTDLFKRIY